MVLEAEVFSAPDAGTCRASESRDTAAGMLLIVDLESVPEILRTIIDFSSITAEIKKEGMD